jgi:hypothetical protein
MSIIKMIKTARSMFVTADWRHVYRGVDSSLVEVSYCEGDMLNCQYCAAVRKSAKSARILSGQAIEACKNNDWRQAEDLIQQCVSIESEWGDAPAYGPVAEAMKTL